MAIEQNHAGAKYFYAQMCARRSLPSFNMRLVKSWVIYFRDHIHELAQYNVKKKHASNVLRMLNKMEVGAS